jgi:hypothetical protein
VLSRRDANTTLRHCDAKERLRQIPDPAQVLLGEGSARRSAGEAAGWSLNCSAVVSEDCEVDGAGGVEGFGGAPGRIG